jgi:hypothetical protein
MAKDTPGVTLTTLENVRLRMGLGGRVALTELGAPIRLRNGVPVAARRIRLGEAAQGRRGRTHVETPVVGGETVYIVDTEFLRQRFPILMGPSVLR